MVWNEDFWDTGYERYSKKPDNSVYLRGMIGFDYYNLIGTLCQPKQRVYVVSQGLGLTLAISDN